MKKAGKYVLYGAGALTLVLIGLLLLVKLLLTPERVRATVLPLAQQALQREVRLGEIKVSLFSGVTVRDVAVLEADGKETFVTVDAMVLRYQFWPLLRRQVVIDEISLDGPHLRIVRQVDGRFNFSDLLEPKPGATPTTSAPAADGKPLDLRIAHFAIHRGDLLFIDQVVNPATPLRFTADNLEVSASDLSLDRPFPFELAVRLAGAPVTMSGSLDLAAKGATVKVHLQGLDATAFAPYFQKSLPGKLSTLKISSDLTVGGSTAAVKAGGRISFESIDLTLDALPQMPLKNAVITLDCDASVDLEQEKLTLGRNRLSLGDAVLEFGGTVNNYARDPVTDVTLDFSAGQILLDPFLGEAAKTAALAPTAAATVADAEPGPLDLPLTAKGSGKIKELVYHGLSISDLDVRFTLVRNVLTVSTFSGRVAQGSFSGSKRVDLGRKGFAYQAEVKARQVQAALLVAALFPAAADTLTGGIDLDLHLVGAGTSKTALQRNLSGDGRIAIADAVLSGSGLARGLVGLFQEDDLKTLKFSHFEAGFILKNGQLLIDGDFSGKQVTMRPRGEIGLDGRMDLRLPLRISPEIGRKLSGKSVISGALRDGEGWTVVPLLVKGSMSAPELTFDSKGARQALGGHLQDRLERSLEKRLRKGEESAPGEGDGKTKSSDELRDALKGILGR